MSQIDQINILKKISLFKNLDDQDLQSLLSLFISRRYNRGELILRQYSKGDALFLIIKGRVKVVLYGENGKEIVLSILNANDFFGEMSLLDGKPRSANVMAAEESTILVLERKVFKSHLLQHPLITLSLLEKLCKRLRQADEKIGNLVLLDVYGRVGHILLQMARDHGKPIMGGVLIENRPTHQEISAMVGSSRETVSRALKDLAQKGHITISGKNIIIHKTMILEEY